jgi:hypothetical protein
MSYTHESDSGLDDVVSKLEDIEQAIKNKLDLSGLWIVPFIWALFWCSDAVWHSKLRYSLQYNVNLSKVTIDDKPHDCEFLTAPLGEKHCDYETSVSTIRWATSTTGQPIASYDEGKTWATFTPNAAVRVPQYPTIEGVYVIWQKKSE